MPVHSRISRPKPEEFNAWGRDPHGSIYSIAFLLFGKPLPTIDGIPEYEGDEPSAPPHHGPPSARQLSAMSQDAELLPPPPMISQNGFNQYKPPGWSSSPLFAGLALTFPQSRNLSSPCQRIASSSQRIWNGMTLLIVSLPTMILNLKGWSFIIGLSLLTYHINVRFYSMRTSTPLQWRGSFNEQLSIPASYQ